MIFDDDNDEDHDDIDGNDAYGGDDDIDGDCDDDVIWCWLWRDSMVIIMVVDTLEVSSICYDDDIGAGECS